MSVPAADPNLSVIDPDTLTVLPDASEPKPKPTLWQRFICAVWDSDYYEKSELERRFVHKIDCGILSVVAFGYLMKFIDQTNINNAYVSGMREDLGFKGNEYTYMIVLYNAVYCVLQIPSNVLALKVRPAYLLATCELGWMCATFAQAGAQNTTQLFVFRFFIAFFEAPFQPAAILIMGSWYKPSELGKRLSIWLLSGTAGQAFSGYMMTAINKTLDGAGGLPGWRWMYIICGLMTLPCGLACIWFLPDYPETTKAFYLTEEEKQMGRERCAFQGIKPPTGVVNWKTFKRIISRWHFWVLVPTYPIYAWAVQSYNYFNTYLLLSGYPIVERNLWPSIAFTIGIPMQFFWGYLSDRLRSRLACTLGPMIWSLFPLGCLAFWAPPALRLFAFFADETYFVTHVYFAWINELCKSDAEERAFMIGAANTAFFAFNAWMPPIVFLQTQGPRWQLGFATLFGAAILSCFCFVIVWWFARRQHRQEALEEEIERNGQDVEVVNVEAIDDKKVPVA